MLNLIGFALMGLAGLAYGEEWSSSLGREHPLVGRIWDVRAARYMDAIELRQRLHDATFVLLGETHDNADHHRLQREMLAAMLADGRKPAVAMEQFDRDHQEALDRARIADSADLESVAAAGRFNRDGWHWPLYAPIVEFALANKLPLVAANLSRVDAMRVARQGLRALGGDTPAPATLADWQRARLARVLGEGHCGRIQPPMIAAMIGAQQARDAVMAHALAPYRARGAVLIAGNGHARRDFGVPLHLDGADTLSIGLIEVADNWREAQDYLETPAEFDIVWFTPRAARADPCVTFEPDSAAPDPTPASR
jgi:uncharacterized iron-regulated protein